VGRGQGQGGRGGDGLGPTLNIETINNMHVQGPTEINIRQRDIIISWLSPINFFLRHAEISQLREKGTGGWLLADPVFKNGNLVLEVPFGAVGFVCDSSPLHAPQTNQAEISSRCWENSPCVRPFSTSSGCH
jgi:hypothetical protein